MSEVFESPLFGYLSQRLDRIDLFRSDFTSGRLTDVEGTKYLEVPAEGLTFTLKVSASIKNPCPVDCCFPCLDRMCGSISANRTALVNRARKGQLGLLGIAMNHPKPIFI
jgi:hypothetical protein